PLADGRLPLLRRPLRRPPPDAASPLCFPVSISWVANEWRSVCSLRASGSRQLARPPQLLAALRTISRRGSSHYVPMTIWMPLDTMAPSEFRPDENVAAWLNTAMPTRDG